MKFTTTYVCVSIQYILYSIPTVDPFLSFKFVSILIALFFFKWLDWTHNPAQQIGTLIGQLFMS